MPLHRLSHFRYLLNSLSAVVVMTLGQYPYCSTAQKARTRTDTINFRNLNISQNKFINNVFRQAVGSVERTPAVPHTIEYLNRKSEAPFLPYQGKIIRHINIDPLNFDRSVNDSLKHDNSRTAKLGKAMHAVTRRFVVKDNLFIKENTPLNAFKLADNERYLRGLEYIHDARIIVNTIKDNPDSVDIEILTIDLFSIAGGFATSGPDHFNSNAFENNLGGMGQRLEVDQLYDVHRNPEPGYGIAYRKNNILHSFINGTVGYSTIRQNGFTGEEETSAYLNLTRQLVSPYSRFAGALTLSHNEAYNVYNAPDPMFYKYSYNLFDIWGGYNLGIKKLTASNNTIRDRRFLALRYYNRDYNVLPNQVTSYNPVYNSSSAVLGQITFFRQDYYRTQYIYGFGTTEDLPYGYNVSFTGGWHRQLNLQRAYAGFNANNFIATGKGDFLQLYMRGGGFSHNGTLQDGSFLAGVTAFGRKINWNGVLIRQYLNLSYSFVDYQVTTEPLRINNYYGVRGFLSDSAFGTRRLSFQCETEFFLKYSIYGFRFAPFPYFDLSLLTPPGQPYYKSALYSSLGGGIRMRNENLVFQTIELRAYFFPVAPGNMRGFKLVLSTNVQFRYSSNFITAPGIVQMNSQ